MFGHNKHKHILISLLNAILNFPKDKQIVSVTILNPINFKEKLDDKFSILDIKASDDAGRQYNIEMQVNPEPEYIARVMYYIDKLFIEQLKEAKGYDTLNKTISISILDFNLLLNEKDLHNIYRYKNIKSGKELSDIKEMHFIELKKFNKEKPRELRTAFEKWLHILKFGEQYQGSIESIPEELKEEEMIVMAVKAMGSALADRRMREIINQREKAIHDEITRLNYARREGVREGIEQGIERGIEQGIEKGKIEGIREGKIEGIIEGKIETAKNLLEEGMNINIIKRATGLTEEEINSLKCSK